MSKRAVKRPDDAALLTAAEWLDQYEADVGDNNGAHCQSVAEWIRAEIQERELHRLSRKHGVPVSKIRAVLAKAAP